jgi:hypothetical protein
LKTKCFRFGQQLLTFPQLVVYIEMDTFRVVFFANN